MPIISANTGPHDARGWRTGRQPASIVAADGAVTDGPRPDAIGGLTVVDVPACEEALEWAAKVAVACRCVRPSAG